MNTFERAVQLQDEFIAIRRQLHQNAEVGYNLPKTTALVAEKLKEMGYCPQEICQSGLVATVGSGGKTILLRADMDALPITEESGEAFACTTGAMHSCGHDFHTAILLGVAKILKEHEHELKGTVKLMFQPAEEIFWGARAMIEAGVMENPNVDCAMALHVGTTLGRNTINIRTGPVMSSCNGFKIKIQGKGCHGALPETGIDPINIGAHIHLALQELISRETPLVNGALLTIGLFRAGTAPNIIPDTAELCGTIRTFNESIRDFVVERMKTIATETAKMFRGSAEVEIISDVPVLQNDAEFTTLMEKYIREIPGLEPQILPGPQLGGSEDFALIAKQVPSLMFFLGADPKDADTIYPAHHPKIIMDDEVVLTGITVLADNAMRWLREHC